jgi:hypothetical protein
MDSKKVTNNSIEDLRCMIVMYIKKKQYLQQKYKATLYSHEHQRAKRYRKRLKSILRKAKIKN